MRVSPTRLSLNDPKKLKRLHYREHSFGTSELLLQPREVLFSDFHSSGDQPTDELFKEACGHRAAGQFPAAIKAYEKLLSLRPGLTECVLNLGVCYLKLGEVAKARRLYIQTENSTCEVRYNYALASFIVGKRFQALEALKECKRTATGSLASDVSWALRKLTSERPTKTPLPESPDSELEFSMVIRQSVQSRPRQKYHSLSLCSKPPTHQRLPSGALFRSLEQYAPSTQIDLKPIFSPLPNKLRRKQRPKTSYRVPMRGRAGSSGEQSKVSFAGLNQSSAAGMDGGQSRGTLVEKVRRKGSLVEEDLEDERALRKTGIDLVIEREIHESAARMQQDLDNECSRQLLTESGEIPRGSKLRPEDIAKIREEMAKEAEARDFLLLSKIVSKLKFFGKFKPDVREEVLRGGGHITVAQDDFVFRQGEPGTHVYAVLSGAIIVWRHALEYGAEPLMVHTLYDGDSFGELSLFAPDSGTKGRSASCQAVTDTDLFFLPKEEYHRIMIREVEIGLQAKLSVLLKLPFFDGAHEFALVPLAATLSPLRFKIGQYVLQTGETPKGLHVVVSGRCNIFSEGFSLRPRGEHAIGSTKSSPTASSWSVSPTKRKKTVKDHIVTKEMTDASVGLTRELMAFFKVQNVASLFERFVVIRERKLESVLAEGSYFSGRCLVCPSQDSIEPCKYSVVADSAEVVVYVVTPAQVPLLGERLGGQMLYVLARGKDADCPPNIPREKIREEFTRWNSYKGRVVAQALRRNVG